MYYSHSEIMIHSEIDSLRLNFYGPRGPALNRTYMNVLMYPTADSIRASAARNGSTPRGGRLALAVVRIKARDAPKWIHVGTSRAFGAWQSSLLLHPRRQR